LRRKLDFISEEEDLGQEERMIRDTARQFVYKYVKPDIGDHFEDSTFPTDLIPEMGEPGFYAPNLEAAARRTSPRPPTGC
jgi:glutaryl-CoA dehydrogenase